MLPVDIMNDIFAVSACVVGMCLDKSNSKLLTIGHLICTTTHGVVILNYHCVKSRVKLCLLYCCSICTRV